MQEFKVGQLVFVNRRGGYNGRIWAVVPAGQKPAEHQLAWPTCAYRGHVVHDHVTYIVQRLNEDKPDVLTHPRTSDIVAREVPVEATTSAVESNQMIGSDYVLHQITTSNLGIPSLVDVIVETLALMKPNVIRVNIGQRVFKLVEIDE